MNIDKWHNPQPLPPAAWKRAEAIWDRLHALLSPLGYTVRRMHIDDISVRFGFVLTVELFGVKQQLGYAHAEAILMLERAPWPTEEWATHLAQRVMLETFNCVRKAVDVSAIEPHHVAAPAPTA